MILWIDTTCREKIYLTLFDKNQEKRFEFETRDQSEDLLVAIRGILKIEKILLKDLKAIFVNSGPGSFTGVRVGITVANTLAWALDIPVYGYQESNEEKIIKQITQNNKLHFSKLALPYYA